jgi:pyridoxal phosphate enzyme (YggS family)
VLRERLERVLERIQQACQRCGRDPSSVTLIGVTKGVPPALIQEAIALGVTDLGENRIQEARAKILEMQQNSEFGIRSSEFTPHSELRTPHSVRWHLIGHLQRNKAKQAVELFDVIQSVDSLELVQELERRRAPIAGGPLDVMIQVNVSGEASKFGCRPDEAALLAEAVRRTAHLTLRGLMTIAPYADNPEQTRPVFQQLRHLRDRIDQVVNAPTRERASAEGGSASGGNARTSLLLSMGMSQDFEVAIEEGADLIRVGTAIFGERGTGNGERR